MPPPQPQPQIIKETSLHKGMNSKDQPWLLPENLGTHVEDLIVDKLGARTPRGGVSSIGGRSDKPYGLFRGFDTTLDQEALFALYGNQIFITPGAGVVDRRACGVSLTSNLHRASQGRWLGRTAQYVVQAQPDDSNVSVMSELVAITDDDQTTQATMFAQVGVYWQDRLWVSRGDHDLYWSELGDGLSFSLTGNVATIEPGYGRRITGLMPLRGPTPQILIFKDTAIALLTTFWGSNSALIPLAADSLDVIRSSIRLVSDNTGCVSGSSIQFIPGAPQGDVYFLSREGVRAMRRAEDDTLSDASLPISDPIKTTIERINFTFAHKAVSAVFDNKYHLAVPLDGATENSHVLSFDLITTAWYINTWSPKAFAVSPLQETQDFLWQQYNTITQDCSVTAATSNYGVFKSFTGDLDPGGAPVLFREDSRAYGFGDITRKKTWDWVSIGVKNSGTETALITLLYNVDQQNWVTMATNIGFAGSKLPILGEEPLPWVPTENEIVHRKFSLVDVQPGYFLQIRVLGQSDAALPTVVETDIAARFLDPEFDNTIA